MYNRKEHFVPAFDILILNERVSGDLFGCFFFTIFYILKKKSLSFQFYIELFK